jgi:hypothetical protein
VRCPHRPRFAGITEWVTNTPARPITSKIRQALMPRMRSACCRPIDALFEVRDRPHSSVPYSPGDVVLPLKDRMRMD